MSAPTLESNRTDADDFALQQNLAGALLAWSTFDLGKEAKAPPFAPLAWLTNSSSNVSQFEFNSTVRGSSITWANIAPQLWTNLGPANLSRNVILPMLSVGIEVEGLVDVDVGMLGLLTVRDLMASIFRGPTSRDEDLVSGTRGSADTPVKALRLLDGYEVYGVPGWDGYDASPISAETLAAAKVIARQFPETVAAPNAAPGADGTIGFEWRFDSGPLRKLFIDLGPGAILKVYSEPVRGHPQMRTWVSAYEVSCDDVASFFGVVKPKSAAG